MKWIFLVKRENQDKFKKDGLQGINKPTIKKRS